ncbi:NAD dependent epimerase/dehydratase family [Geosmithia morbida]|uniref:NAD dependent epimerase/dehydratase family n=1 Tax=Geosmithia morbida TaxID=1094350 RepID=A0A9P4Z1J0_9HYPO|nr:NAD dependent epimerase/dehydratase family [Geosmithia morbida]KAF4125578.1 NAD dependent epimerase/dehydratase family [Geosmithia morbida]
MTSPIPAAVFGSTGLTGSFTLATLLTSESQWGPVHTISRRAPSNPTSSPSLNSVLESDTSKWASSLGSLSPVPQVVFSSVGTTRVAAGGLEQQWKIDHDLNIEIAKAAKAAGARTFVFISSGGTRGFATSSLPYSRMKNGVEDAVRDLDFDNAVILKPGFINGHREQDRIRNFEGLFQTVVGLLGKASTAAKDAISQDADVIGRAAVKAAELAAQGKAPAKFWLVSPAEIVKLGRKEE